ncbi:MAG: DNA gyrase inhibitor YacG [Dongiaceae bacterium]
MSASVKPTRKTARANRSGKGCPICGEPAAERFQPFCSTKCADIDLGRWLTNQYRIPTQEPAEGSEGTGEDGDEGDR